MAGVGESTVAGDLPHSPPRNIHGRISPSISFPAEKNIRYFGSPYILSPRIICNHIQIDIPTPTITLLTLTHNHPHQNQNKFEDPYMKMKIEQNKCKRIK
jgi:hypothetical protein